jgi:hypothetical protein
MHCSLQEFVLVFALLCIAIGLAAAFPEVAFASIYFLLYPLAVLAMVSMIVGVLVLGRFLVERIRR